VQRAHQQGQVAVAFDPAELSFESDERGRTLALLLITRAPARHPATPRLDTGHDGFEHVRRLEAGPEVRETPSRCSVSVSSRPSARLAAAEVFTMRSSRLRPTASDEIEG
jgi:hypothetical protein